ncbi:MAG TPA: DinB family protein [Bacteroidia bacterium]|nr:DinB family protein [Bacteroidia bacterium]
MKTELQTYRDLVAETRNLIRYYLKKLEGADVRKRWEIDGKKLNSIYWLVAHMTWAQNNLLLRSSGGPNPGIKWLKFFGMGKSPDEGEVNGPSWEEVQEGFKRVHELALAHLNAMDPSLLDSPNKLDWEVMGSKTIRATIMHHIRHENTHAGHLSWLAKLNERVTI